MRRGLVAAATGLVLCLPTAGFAQEAEGATSEPAAEVGVGDASSVDQPAARDRTAQQPEDQTGIGEPDAVECRGTVAATVVDRDGAPVSGATLAVAGERLAGSGAVESLCGEIAATLLVAPDGYAPTGPTTLNVQVRREVTTAVTFTVDSVEVLGTVFERPAQAPAPSTPATPGAPDAAGEDVPAELPATGPTDAPVLLLVALLCGLLGTVLVGFTSPAPARVRPTR